MMGLTLEERGVYNTLLDLMYSTWKPVRDNDRDDRAFVVGWMGCAAQKVNPIVERLVDKGRVIRIKIEGKIYLSDEAFEKERLQVKGAKVPKKSPQTQEKSGDVETKSEEVEPKSPLPDTGNQENQDVTDLEKRREEKNIRENISKDKFSLSEESDLGKQKTFEDFRRPYLKFDGLNAARKEWDAAIAGGVNPQDIIDGLTRWNAEWERRIGDPNINFRPEHIPNAGKWLGGKGWLDPTPLDGGTHTVAARSWPGPSAIREAVVREAGEDFAKSYLDPAEWDASTGAEAIIAANGYAADKLRTILRLKTYTIRKRTEEAAA
jgi:uncharacterized protein YdaU (DUF1376 family)